ncbi:hypothetical protein RFI_29527 [Reticulomyxa filosa]|uniref:Viral A-type inclusion protein n=1 Tax=Reticulomyxa filosa TaxID=46433 RepID=X6M1X7_RETFI|nr:hypothetical protein RFI_29527 [Reticulomyxa filosa]|eukprot:ETO07864.1 hypothetical protein RFI_29527 [Reticulomyxa filosa]
MLTNYIALLCVKNLFVLKLELDDSTDSEKQRLTKILLAKGHISPNNLKIWSRLFNLTVEKNSDTWEKLLIESQKEWWNSDSFGDKCPGKCYHRKALWFLYPSRYRKMPKQFYNVFKGQVELTVGNFLFDNKCWDKDTKNELCGYIGDPKSDLSEWNWLLTLLIKIPSEYGIKTEPNEDEKSFSQSEEIGNGNELLKHNLEYCISCVGWDTLLVKHRNKIKILDDLYGFIQTTLETLNRVIKKKKSINETHIKTLRKTVGKEIDEEVWKSSLERFENVKQISTNFDIVAREYFKTTPSGLQEFHDYIKLDHYCLADIEANCAEEMKLLDSYKNELQLMTDRAKSKVFCEMWADQRSVYRQNPISTIHDFMNVFKQANLDWEHLTSTIEENNLPYSDLEWYNSINWELEISMLFPKLKPEEKDKLQKNKTSEIKKATDLQKTRHCWQVLKQLTEIIQNAHEKKSDIKCDETWSKFLEQFEVIDKLEKNKQILIREVSKHYDACVKCFGDIAESANVKNEKKIRELVSNEIFTNKQQFEYAACRIDNSRNKSFRLLAGELREINEILQTKIWDCNFPSMSALAKAVFNLFEESNDQFQKKLEGFLKVDFDEFLRIGKEGDQLSVMRCYKQIQQVQQIGRWVLSDYKTLLSSEQKKEIEAIIMQFDICKDIYGIRMDYWEQGGRNKIGDLILQTKDSTECFGNCKQEWINELDKWKSFCVELRYNYPGLTYFTMNEAQHLIEMINQILKLDEQYRDAFISKYILPYFRRLDYGLQDASKMLNEWKGMSDKEPLKSLGKIVSTIWKNSSNNKIISGRNAQITSLCQGKPNLIISMNKKNLLQFWIYNTQVSLYCLVWPEKLAMKTQAKAIKLLQRMLLHQCKLQQVQWYLFAVVSSNMENDVAVALRLFQSEFTFNESNASIDVEEALYTKQLDSFLNDKSNRKPFVQLYKSEHIGMGKTWRIQEDIKEYQKERKLEKIYVRFNSSDIDWELIVNTFWPYHSCKLDNLDNIRNLQTSISQLKDALVVYHLDISSCVNEDMNDFLFQLLYLQHIDTDCSSFYMNPNMAFFVEIPSQFHSLEDTANNVLYTLFPESNFPTIIVDEVSNPFQLGNEAQNCIKWILQTKKSEPITISDKDMTDFIKSYFALVRPYPLNYTILFKFLSTQFKLLSDFNDPKCSDQFRYKQEATKCVIAIAQELFANTNTKGDDTQFCLCKKLNRSESFYLINHNGIEYIDKCFHCVNVFFFFFCDKHFMVCKKGSLSLLIPTADKVNAKARADLKKAKIILISWKEETKRMWDIFFGVMDVHSFFYDEIILKTKQERIDILCHMVGVPKERRKEIKKTLCEGEFKHYVLTYDNILKMTTILLNIRSDLPVLHYI